ncbi:MAG: hypothetical protein KDE32_08060 [Novosphingobium sp.]|nr:hypothetical protein [Novosphingobium sp.]
MKRIGNRLVRALSRHDGNDDAIHFLHIGKAAGTQIKTLAEQVPGKIIVHGHDKSLRDLPLSARYFFSIRDPVSRFYSGFYSRKRKGQPTYNIEWNACEAAAFRDFEHANDLAEALFETGKTAASATQAIISIRHTGQNLTSWFLQQGNILEVRPPVWIIRQENFAQDFKAFLRQAGLEDAGVVPVGKRHANDYADDPPLSPKAIANLERWYAQDYAFHAVCEEWLREQTVKSDTG